MNLNDVLKLPIFEDAKLKTGQIGLSNKIESVMILEAPDIELWGRKSQLILTSYFALQDMNNDELITFIKKSSNIGISGIVLKIDRLVESAPEYFLDLCIKYKIPLIEIPKKINYEKIIISIFEPILNYESSLLRTYYQTNQLFSNISGDEMSYEKILSEAHKLLQKPCRLTIPEYDINISIGDFNISSKPENEITNYSTSYTKNDYQLIKINNDLFILNIKNESNNFIQYTFEILQESNNIKESEIMITETVLEIINREIYKENYIKKERYILLNNIAASILFNTYTTVEELDNLLEEADLNKRKYYQSVVILKEDNEDIFKIKYILKKLESLNNHCIYYENRKYLILIFNILSLDQKITKDGILMLFSNTISHQIFLTEIKDKEHIKDLINECNSMYNFNKNYHIGNIISINDLGVFRFLSEISPNEIDKYIPEPLLDLYKYEKTLFNTFYVFIKNNQNYKKTADEMFLHPKSIRYRINKIEELMKLDINNSMELINFSICTYLLVLRERKMNNNVN